MCNRKEVGNKQRNSCPQRRNDEVTTEERMWQCPVYNTRTHSVSTITRALPILHNMYSRPIPMVDRDGFQDRNLFGHLMTSLTYPQVLP